MPATTFDEIQSETPTAEGVAREYAALEADLSAASTLGSRQAVLQRWDDLRRRLDTWEALVSLRSQQDTRDPERKAARDYKDALTPKLTDHAVRMKRRLLAEPLRTAVRETYGPYVLSLWEADVLTFEPAIEARLVEESKLDAEYTDLLAAAKIELRGKSYNLSEIVKWKEDADRGLRLESEVARWGFFAANRERLDGIYDRLVRLRTDMARTLGFDDFRGLGYKRMKRIDYGMADVERFRAEVREHLVPLCAELRAKQAATLGVDRLRFWDESVHDPRGNPAPSGDHDVLVGAAQGMFDAMHPVLGDFFRLLVEGKLIDLKNREGKAGGGFCTSFPSVGLPFVYANFNGTKHDVEVLTHEIGHALQGYLSREKPISDYLWPTLESCEIHSMGLEFLTWPFMERFFGADAARFRRVHLTQALLFIPYGVAVDHFQHLVYAEPDATPARRHEMWQEMERTYLPERDYGDLPHVKDGGVWQAQRHIYRMPFYYIDYTLAQTCALQLWVRSQKDPQGTLESYLALCRRGGEAPFQELARSAGITSPFQPGCLRDVAALARAELMRPA